jgi:multiple sugar transport system permease protein
MDNFSYVLFDRRFWHSLWVSVQYAALYMIFAFFAPILLAILLQEVPRGKVIYRVIYYLPAVLSGAIVLFMWKAFYSPSGPVNDLVNHVIRATNAVVGTDWEPVAIDWLQDDRFALLFCLLPTIWAGLGPGCLIYLAALKTVSDELYEAADLDGASIRQKVFHITLPSIKVLIMINLIFALVGAIRGSASFMLAMTGGGPFDEVYGTTEVVGLTIWYTAFARLNFGLATAQAWVLGAILVGFTLLQLKRLRSVEFRAAGAEAK